MIAKAWGLERGAGITGPWGILRRPGDVLYLDCGDYPAHMFVRTHRTLHQKKVHFPACKLHLSKPNFKFKQSTGTMKQQIKGP